MDEVTRKRLEQKQAREMESDYSISLVDYNYSNILKISWLDIINYCCEKISQGLCRSRVKELFLEEIVDPKLAEIDVDFDNIETDIEVQNELAKYNYDDCE